MDSDPANNSFRHTDELPSDLTGSVVEGLIQAILNEKNSPDILQYDERIVKKIQQEIQKQEDAVEDLERDHQQELKRIVFNLELKRVRYLLRLYLRTRLHKLEACAVYLLEEDDMLSRLSLLEQNYVHDYFVIAGRHLSLTVLNQLPEDFNSMVKSHELGEQGNDLVAKPALDSHVFCSILEDVGSVQLDEDQVVDMKASDLFIVRYEAIASLVGAGQAVLV